MEQAHGLALADAADVLSDQLRAHLHRLAMLLAPMAERLGRHFQKRLRQRQFDPKQCSALAAITPGAAATMLSAGLSISQFLEQVEYNGRRLAKLNVPPGDLVRAAEDYDALLAPALAHLPPEEYANFRWVRDQLNFCVLLTLNKAYYRVREAETHAFFELFRVELESHNLDELLRNFLTTLNEFCHADASHLFLLNDQQRYWISKARIEGDELREGNLEAVKNDAAWRKSLARPVYITKGSRAERRLLDPGWKGNFSSFWSIPLIADSRLAGVVQFAFQRPYEWLPREQDLLRVAGERCLIAAEKARLMEDLAAREEQVRQLAEHMLHVEEVERRRISRELHDETGQSMLCIRLQLEMLEQALRGDREEFREKVAETRGLAEHTILEMRRLIAALSPAVLEQLGLAAALRQLIHRFRQAYDCRPRLHLGRLESLPKKTEMIVYRLVQECCNNIAKHSGATIVNISVASADELLRLNVEDNGVGFDVEEAFAKQDSFGLAGMRERVALLGGTFRVISCRAGDGKRARSGTKISIALPVPSDGMR